MAVIEAQNVWAEECMRQHQKNNVFSSVDSVDELRYSALQSLFKQGWPTRKTEGWQYTSVSSLLKKSFLHVNDHPQKTALPVATLPDAITLVFIDGFLHPELSDLQCFPDGVTVVEFEQLSQALCRDYVKSLNQLAKTTHPFALLNVAMAKNGCSINIAAGVKVDSPIELVYINTQEFLSCQYHIHNVVNISEGAKATVFEHYVSLYDVAYLNNVVTEFNVSKGAHLDYFKLQNESVSAYHAANITFNLNTQAALNASVINLGSSWQRDDVTLNLLAENSQANLAVLSLGAKDQRLACFSQALHQAAEATSKQMVKSIANDSATITINGRIYVAPGSRKTSAGFQNRNLLLSSTASINTKPELEIYNDDVICSHGATVGELDQAALFYLRSRGLSLEQAQAVLLQGFIQEILERDMPTTLNALLRGAIEKHNILGVEEVSGE